MINVPTADDHNALDARTDVLEAALAALETALASADTRLDDVEDDVVGLETQQAALGNRLDAVEIDVAALETGVGAVQADVAAFESAHTLLEARVDAAEDDISDLEVNSTAQASELVAHDGELVELANAISALAARITALEIPVPAPPPPPPASLTGLDIGTGVAGSTTETAPGFDFTVVAEGLDIYGTADSFRFSHRPISGDFDQLVRIQAFTGPDASGKAGLMVRDGLAANARNVFMGATINNGYRFQHRTTAGGATTKVESGTVAYPNVWVRLKRVGNVFTGYLSTDGLTWTQQGTVTVSLPTDLNIGLAVNSRSAGNTANAQCVALGVVPPAQNTYTPSGPIVATTGQTITGVRIAGVGGTAITVRDVTDVTIIDVQIEGTGGHGVLIQNAQRVKVLNSTIKPGRNKTTLDTQHGVCLRDSVDVLVQGNKIEDAESSVHAVGGHTVTVKGNYSKNPKGPFPRGQHFQGYPVNRDGPVERGLVIDQNYFVNDEGTAPIDDRVGVEDSINIGSRSRYAKVTNNYVIGGRAYSGCGIVLEGGVDYGLVKGNTLIRTSQCGCNIVASAWCVVEENKVLDTSLAGAEGNQGLSSWFHSGDTRSHDNIFRNNIVSNKRPDGSYADIYIKSGSGTQTNNTKGDAARALLVPEATFLPPPPIPPVPWTP